ncbi:MAG TPA: DUF5666 domain-containing protein [Thermomicrobiales bacterium]|jgi:hypothetical protein
MRRRAITILVLAIIVAAFFGTWRIAYRMGESDGRSKVVAARAAFLARSGGTPQPAGNGQSAAGGGQRGTGGGSAVTGSAANGTPTSGSPRTGGGQRAAGGTPAQTAGSSLTGHVTTIAGPIISVQQADNSTVMVTTDSTTAIEKLVVGALTDLKTGDLIAVDGTKTGDTAYSAKTITSLGQRAAGGRQRPAGSTGGQSPPAGGAAAVTGQIMSIASGTITVQGFDGTTVTVTSSPATVVTTRQPGTLADIKTGDLLVVQGDKSGDTGFLARSIINQGASG